MLGFHLRKKKPTHDLMETEQLVDLKRAFSSPLPLSKSCCSAGGAISHNLHIWQRWLIWIFQESVVLSFQIFWHSLLFVTPGCLKSQQPNRHGVTLHSRSLTIREASVVA